MDIENRKEELMGEIQKECFTEADEDGEYTLPPDNITLLEFFIDKIVKLEERIENLERKQ